MEDEPFVYPKQSSDASTPHPLQKLSVCFTYIVIQIIQLYEKFRKFHHCFVCFNMSLLDVYGCSLLYSIIPPSFFA